MKPLYRIALLGSFLLLAYQRAIFSQEETLNIQSGEAIYNGKEIFLTGHVVIEHELGQLSAQQLTLVPAAKEKKLRFSLLKLNQNVMIQSKDSGQLECQEANIDYENLKGQFLGNQESPDVIYSNRGSPVSLLVKSLRMDVELSRDYQPHTQQHKSSFRQVQASGLVRAVYDQQYLIKGDRAVYERQPATEFREPLEVLVVYAEESPQARCFINGPNGDEIQANKIIMNLITRQMDFDHPTGTLYLCQDSQSHKQPIHFSCEKMKWNERDQALILQGQVELYQGGLGYVKTNKEMRIYQYIKEGRKGVHSIVSDQETELTYLNPETKQAHKVLCHGPLIIDHEKMRILMHSPLNEKGQIGPKDQVYFEDIAGELYADDVCLDYQWEKQKILPHHLILQGHVKILNRFDGHIQESSTILQYALADRVDYFPKQKEMVLVSQAPQRVLLFDRVNQLQMSAPSLKIRHEEQSGKLRFQGIGDVRFTFIKQEFDQLKEQFSLEDSAQ